MRPATHNITIQRGEDFSLTFNVTIDDVVLNLTGATAYAQIRETAARDSTLLANMTTAITETGANANNYVTITLDDANSANITNSQGWYDVLVVDANNTDTYYLRGQVTMEGSVTVKA